MAYEALRHYSRRDMTFRFVSNVDGTDFAEATRDLDPAETLFIDLLEDLHDAGDDDQRPQRPRVVRWPALGGDEARGRQALRRRLDQRRRGGEVRHRHRQHVRLLGVGGRPLLDGLGDRPLDHAGDRPGPLREMLAGFHAIDEHFREAPLAREPAGADGPARGLVHRLLRRPDRAVSSLRPVPASLPGLPAAADDGVQRQARDPRRRAGSTTTPARSTGASRAPTASTPSTS